jgi:hypothetical protein
VERPAERTTLTALLRRRRWAVEEDGGTRTSRVDLRWLDAGVTRAQRAGHDRGGALPHERCGGGGASGRRRRPGRRQEAGEKRRPRRRGAPPLIQ